MLREDEDDDTSAVAALALAGEDATMCAYPPLRADQAAGAGADDRGGRGCGATNALSSSPSPLLLLLL